MGEAVPPFPQYAIMWCSVKKHKNNFMFIFNKLFNINNNMTL